MNREQIAERLTWCQRVFSEDHCARLFEDVAAMIAEAVADDLRACAALFASPPGCTCAPVDIGVGEMHEPCCGMLSYGEVAGMILDRAAQAEKEER